MYSNVSPVSPSLVPVVSGKSSAILPPEASSSPSTAGSPDYVASPGSKSMAGHLLSAKYGGTTTPSAGVSWTANANTSYNNIRKRHRGDLLTSNPTDLDPMSDHGHKRWTRIIFHQLGRNLPNRRLLAIALSITGLLLLVVLKLTTKPIPVVPDTTINYERTPLPPPLMIPPVQEVDPGLSGPNQKPSPLNRFHRRSQQQVDATYDDGAVQDAEHHEIEVPAAVDHQGQIIEEPPQQPQQPQQPPQQQQQPQQPSQQEQEAPQQIESHLDSQHETRHEEEVPQPIEDQPAINPANQEYQPAPPVPMGQSVETGENNNAVPIIQSDEPPQPVYEEVAPQPIDSQEEEVFVDPPQHERRPNRPSHHEEV